MPKDRLKSDAHMLHIHMQHKQSGTFRLTLPCTEATDLTVRDWAFAAGSRTRTFLRSAHAYMHQTDNLLIELCIE